MSQTLQNQILIAKSMQGIVSLSDGAGTNISNGQISTGNISGGNITGNTISGTSFSTINKSLMDTVLTVATSATPYNWVYNTAQNIVFTGVNSQIFVLPVVSSLNLGTVVCIFRTASASFTINAATGYFLFDWNNAVLSTRSLSTVDRVITLVAVSTGTTQWQMTSQTSNQLINATLSLQQTFTAKKVFNAGADFTTVLPTSSLTPTLSTELVNKSYADSTPATLLLANNVWTGTNAFNTSLPTSTLTPTSNSQLITKVYADGLTTNLLAANNIWAGTNQYNNNVSMGTAGYFLPYFPLTSTSMRIGLNSMQRNLATSTNCLVWGNGTMQGTTNPSYTNVHTNTICIGNGAMSSTVYGTTTTSNNDNVVVGQDAGKNMCLNSNDNVIIGSQCVKGSPIGTVVDSVIIGSRCFQNGGSPTYSTVVGAKNFQSGTAVNYGTIYGTGNLAFSTLTYANGLLIFGSSNMLYTTGFNNAICIGATSLTNLSNNYSTICIGVSSLANLTTGTGVICLGSYANCSGNLTNTTMLGVWAQADSSIHNNALYVGGNDNGGVYQDILPAKKNRLYCNQTFSSAVSSISISFETADNVVIDNATINSILLPSILGSYNIGAKFTITRSSVGTSSILIDAGTGYFIQSGSGLSQTLSWTLNQQYITLVCISLTTWNVVCNDLVNKIITTNTSTNANFYPIFVASSTSGAYQSINMNTTLSYNPSTNNLSTTTFTGALVGNATSATTASSATTATTATTATNATNVNTTLDTTSTVLYPLMGLATSGLQGALANTNLTYNASTGQLGATKILQTGLNGLAASASAGGVQALTFGINETIILDSSPITTGFTLPSCASINVGARFTFISRLGNKNYNITASGTEQIYDFRKNYITTVFAMNGIGSLTLVCVGTGNGNTCWVVQNRGDGTSSAAANIIAANFSFATVANLPVRDTYSVANGATAITITLLTITLDNLGISITFRRVATATATVSFIGGDGTQFVYNNVNVGGSTAQAIMTSTTYIVKFTALVVSGTTYAWFQV